MRKRIVKTEKVKITFVLPVLLQGELKLNINKAGYDKKGKSRWISESIETLLTIESFPELVKISDTMKGFEKHESVIVSKHLKKQLDEAVINIRRIYPDMDGVQSRIIRTAIVQRLLRCQ